VIYGGVEPKKYILEANDCVCAPLTTTTMAGGTPFCLSGKHLRILPKPQDALVALGVYLYVRVFAGEQQNNSVALPMIE
jgi:hypothetical protein